MKINEVLSQVDESVLTTEAKQAIVEAFQVAVDAKTAERVELEVKNAIVQVDEDHSNKLVRLLEAIDNDHANKLLAVVKKVDEDHTLKLRRIIGRYETILKEEAGQFKDSFINEISNYLELYVDRTIPKEQVMEATKNTSARNMIESIKKIVAVDKTFINENIKEALVDGKQQIDGLRAELNKTIQENVKINKENNAIKTKLMLEKNTMSFPEEKKQYVMRVLSDKSPEYIKENFSYVVEMYNRDEQDSREVIREEATKTAVSNTVKHPKLVLESVTQTGTSEDSSDSLTNMYLSELHKIDGVKK